MLESYFNQNMPKSVVELRPYQVEAINSWIDKGLVGFFEMATGTGKTITSLNCARHVLDLEGKINLLVLVPTLDLAMQWQEDVKKFVCRNIILANSKNNAWYSEAINAISIQDRSSFCIITTYATFLTKRFQFIVSKMSSDSMLIADEAHNFGTKLHLSLYPKNIGRRLGLSATPIRHFDEQGTNAIMDYFNASKGSTFNFSMENAIKEGYLCEYLYYPVIVPLTDEELKEYKAISKKLAKYFTSGCLEDSAIVTALLLKRKRVIHNAYGKFEVLRWIIREFLEEGRTLKHILLYVPEGNSKNIDDNDRKLINKYSQIIGEEFSLNQHQFIGSTKDRENILQQFSDGKIEVLTAMKCLDEGVDIKRAEVAIFCASTGNPRQFIQRRGRILRTHPDKKKAIIYDMIVVPSIEQNETIEIVSMERKILQAELSRVHEFASLAINHYQSLQSLEEIAKKYDLDIYSKINS